MQQYSTRYGQYRTAADAVRFPNIPLPYVSNMAEFKNRRVLVLNEQGFGDEIMFSRAFQHAKDSAKRVLIQCWPELLKTFQVSFPRVQFFIDRLFDIEFVNQFDCWSSTGDLFANLASAECEFAPVHRLKSSRVAEPTNDRKKIGICWSSNPKSVISQEKSLKFEELELFRTIEDAEIYAFQTNGVSIPSWMIDLSDKLKTFDDTAHHLEQMDLVISIDTAVAHLAGAMQKPTILVINDYLDWRWKYTDENKISKLYSTVKVMGKLELAEFLNSHQ
jgi:hypothetical protein